MRIKLTVILLIICFCFANAQKGRPKIGLTLSGGGAKGLAHIGILQAIDSAGLKVDYITGTSMGAIIGAMYAVGYSGNQIDSIVSEIDWNILFGAGPSYYDIAIDEKDEFERHSVEIPFLGIKPQISTGFIESEELWLTFADVFFPVYDIKDFSQFSIPFSCIATDLNNGSAMVLSSGEIATALRSSMAIPSVFSTVKYKSTQLVDGGVVRNFPVIDIKRMGADYVIGINLFSGLPKATSLENMVDVLYQIMNFIDAEDLESEKAMCDILIEPELDEYSAGSFGESDTIRKIGKELGDRYYPIFKALADSLNRIDSIEYDAYSRLPKVDSVIIDQFEIYGLENTSRKMLNRKLNIEEGKAYDTKTLNESFRKAYSSRYYNVLRYEFLPLDSGHVRMITFVDENTLSNVKLGLHYDKFTNAGVSFNYVRRNLLFDKSRTMFRVFIGENKRLNVHHKQSYGYTLRNIFKIYSKYDEIDIPLYSERDLLYIYRTQYLKSGASIGRLVHNNAMTSMGVELKNTWFEPDVAATNRTRGAISSLFPFVSWEVNTLDRSFIPQSGVYLKFVAGLERNRYSSTEELTSPVDPGLDSTILTPDEKFEKIMFTLSTYKKVHEHFTLFSGLDAGLIFENNGFFTDNFLIGSTQAKFSNQIPFVGLLDAQINTPRYAGFGTGICYEIVSDLYLIGRFNMGVYDFKISQDILKYFKYKTGVGLTLAYGFKFLPFEFSFMYSPEINRIYSNVQVGYRF